MTAADDRPMGGGEPVAEPQPLRDRRVVLGVSGSIAAFKAFEIARRLEALGATVDVALTANGARFAPPLSFRNLVRGEVTADMWATDAPPELHVELGRRADVFAVAPASATTIAKLAHGVGDSMVTLTALATTAPVVVAPAMDAQMYAHPAVQVNLELLKARDVLIAGPTEGRLASGHRGLGRMIEPPEVVGAIRAQLGRRTGDLRGRHVLVTAGGTREAMDPVRYVGNRSSGKMGFALAEAARDRGAAVTLVTTQPPPAGLFGVVTQRVESAAEMWKMVEPRLPGTDVLIMAAAVADFRPRQRAEQKIKKGASDDGLTLELERTTDILAAAGGRPLKVGFAAETEDLLKHAEAKLREKGLDLIAANDISAPDAGFAVETNRVTILAADGAPEVLPLLHKYDVARRLLDRVVVLLEG